VAAIRDGKILVRKDTWIGPEYQGHITGINSVDVRSIGAGGGSIAWVDSGGLLRVGPQSAGALPGPACYQRGGTAPTVTDAAVVLGYVDPTWFLGGRMQISEESARRAILEGVAHRLGMGLEEAAAGILQVTTLEMVTAIQDITVNQGLDPRESILVAGGGAAGLNTLPIAQELGIHRVLVPRAAGAFSALGGLISDMKAEYSASQFTDSLRFNYEKVNAVLHDLKRRAVAFLDRMQVPDGDRKLEYIVEARYPYQVWELEVPFGDLPITSAVVRELEEGFHRAHDRVFGVSEPGQYIECVNWVVRAIGRGLAAHLPAEPHRTTRSEPRVVRRAYFPSGGGWVEAPFYHGEDLGPSQRISGPAIVLEDTSTLVVYPGCTVDVTVHHNYLAQVPLETDGRPAPLS
jgi:N-methylhydantoinase A